MRLINAARGGIYDEAALVEGLKAGKLGGVALDVFATEPCTDSPLFGMPGVVCTPHLGASTEEAQTQVAVEAVELLVAYLTTGAIRARGERRVARSEDARIAPRLSRRRLPAGHAAGRTWNRAACGRAGCCTAAKSRRRKRRCSRPCSPPGCCRAASIRK